MGTRRMGAYGYKPLRSSRTHVDWAACPCAHRTLHSLAIDASIDCTSGHLHDAMICFEMQEEKTRLSASE
jgi:hypothetical protein